MNPTANENGHQPAGQVHFGNVAKLRISVRARCEKSDVHYVSCLLSQALTTSYREYKMSSILSECARSVSPLAPFLAPLTFILNDKLKASSQT
jgi:hypothetical protein